MENAERIINETLEETEGSAALEEMRLRAKFLEDSERQQVERYCDAVRAQVQGALVRDLEDGVGGQWDGSQISIATATLVVDDSIETTIDRVEEVAAHEQYHSDHNHMESFADVTIGGEEFTHTQLIEGLTVAKTGNTFVSDEYREYEARLKQAVSRSGINLDTVERAIDEGALAA